MDWAVTVQRLKPAVEFGVRWSVESSSEESVWRAPELVGVGRVAAGEKSPASYITVRATLRSERALKEHQLKKSKARSLL